MSAIACAARRWALIWALFASTAVTLGTTFPLGAAAQTLGQERRLEQSRPDLPRYDHPQRGGDPLAPLPPIPGAAALGGGGSVSSGAAFSVRKIELTGNTVFSAEALTPLVAPYEGRALTVEDLVKLQRELTLHYVNAGYVNSGAVIPDQKIADGVVRLELVEGKLDQIDVVGARRLQPEWIEGRLRAAAGEPLNVSQLQDNMQVLLNDPSIERMNAKLGPGTRPGESRFEVDVTEIETPHYLVASFANTHSTSVGSEAGQVEMGLRSAFGFSDPLALRAAAGEGVREFGFDYSLPVTTSDLRLHLRGDYSQSLVVEKPLDDLDIRGQSLSGEFGLRHPIYRSAADDSSVELSLARRHSTTTLLGEQYSFASGAENGEFDVTALRFTQDWTHREREQVWALRSQLSSGLDALGATVHREDTPTGSQPDGQFVSWLAQAQYARRLFDDHQVIVRLDFQYAFDRLPGLEQIAIGGMHSVRGYRENQVIRDNALIASFEYRLPLFQYALWDDAKDPEAGRFEVVPFFDYARGWDKATTPLPRTLFSAGIGLRWNPISPVSAELYWGYPLNQSPEPQTVNRFQDNGLSFLLRAKIL